ncbi:MAG: hypothetical protein K9K37_05510 [Desulfocapsa sp.]|nr:hypothetical protein [Desulfocapsa sp.]
MSKVRTVLLLILASVFLFCSLVNARPTLKITALVLDENTVPIEETDVTVWYMLPDKSGIGTDDRADKGKSNKEGLFTSSGESFMPQVTIDVQCEGYYGSGKIVKFESRSKLFNRWEPWNPTVEVMLKKKRSPVPMYIKYIEATTIPILNSIVGYDLEKGDWVSPHGDGAINDLIFLCQNKYENFTNAETSCEISFSNQKDGFQEYQFNNNDLSYYKWPFEAPTEGYNIKNMNKWMSVHLPRESYKSNYQENTNYLFRVRTEVDENGNVVKANYGKLKGDIRVYKKAQVNFFYYYNPDGTRNLEEDPKRNLFFNK